MVRALRNSQAGPFYFDYPQGEMRLVNKIFGKVYRT